jgi:flagellar L-ring protein precursor FlgH
MAMKVNLVKLQQVGVLVAGLALLNGCYPKPNDPRYAPTFPAYELPPAKSNGAIYQEGHAIALFEDRKAKRVGDILTVRLEERTVATKKAEMKTSKKTGVNYPAPTLFGQEVNELTFDVQSDQSFDGKGDAKQDNRLTGTITVTVARVLPNNNLLVQGESWITLNRGHEFIRLTGIVRREDIDADNEISSRRVANARITYSGVGQVAETNSAGWLKRFFSGLTLY